MISNHISTDSERNTTMAVHIIDEARRCLQCKKPICIEGCPINTNIPKMIQLLLDGEIDQAGQMLFDNNPMSLICSLVCNHESQCEGHCVLYRKNNAVHISSIEQYISDSYFDKMQLETSEHKRGMVAVIGAGPAGLTISFVLRRMGYDVTIFDSKDKIGGVLQYGIPEFRLPKSILERYRSKLLHMGVRIRPNTTIGGALEIEDLFRDGYLSVFIGTGVWRPNILKIPGESLGNVHYAINYLANPDAFVLGDRVAIIGMGNAAMDVARTILRHGSRHVTLFELSERAAANEHELKYAKLDGAKFEYNMAVQRIEVTGPVFKKVIRDEQGNQIALSNEEYKEDADSVIIAISQKPLNRLVRTTEGLEAKKGGLLVTNEDGHTTREGVFAAGDVVLGAKTVVEAVAYSMGVAQSMHEYMQALDQ